jgi:hypothetical protein
MNPGHSASGPLVVAITSRALFDLEDSHALYEREGIEAFRRHQRQRRSFPASRFPWCASCWR